MPRMMRYTPKAAKECLRTYSIRPRITSRLTRKLTTQPMASMPISGPPKAAPLRKNYKSLMALAPSMVGMAIKKLNSAAAGRLAPTRMPPRMVEPDREVPGTRLRH